MSYNLTYNLSHFSDSENLSVVRGIVRFRCNGNSYLEKLKNGLSLDSVIRSQLICEMCNFSKHNKNNLTKEINEKIISSIEDRFIVISPPKLRNKSKKYKSKKRILSKKNKSKLLRIMGFRYKKWEYDQTILTDEICNNEELCKACSRESYYDW